MEQEYENLTTDDFVRDTFFYEWVTAPTEAHHLFWHSWLARHPEKTPAIEAARDMIFNTMLRDNAGLSDYLESDWQGVKVAITGSGKRISYPGKTFLRFAIAASLLLVGLLAGGYFLSPSGADRWQQAMTKYGEKKEIVLPDGSKVILNGNSQLRYAASLGDRADTREVWLNGEAFFQVTEKNASVRGKETPVRFTVHAHHLDVEVLGTSFNVLARPQKTQVVLNEGSVRVLDEENNSKILEPGEMVQLQDGQGLEEVFVNAAALSSWKGDKIVFDNKPVKEIFQWMEETYGHKIHVEAIELLNKRYTGSVPAENVALLFQKLATLYDLHLEWQGKHIWFRKHCATDRRGQVHNRHAVAMGKTYFP